MSVDDLTSNPLGSGSLGNYLIEIALRRLVVFGQFQQLSIQPDVGIAGAFRDTGESRAIVVVFDVEILVASVNRQHSGGAKGEDFGHIV